MYGDTEDFPAAKGSQLWSFIKDWGLALLLTGLGFFLLSYFRTPSLPDQAPDWTLKDVNGETVSLSDFQGQTVVLNFWATWCGPCRTEIPAFSAFAKENPDIPVLGISIDNASPGVVKRAAKSLGITYPVLMADSRIQQDYKVGSIPMTVIVDPQGQVKDVHLGVMLETQLNWAAK